MHSYHVLMLKWLTVRTVSLKSCFRAKASVITSRALLYFNRYLLFQETLPGHIHANTHTHTQLHIYTHIHTTHIGKSTHVKS